MQQVRPRGEPSGGAVLPAAAPGKPGGQEQGDQGWGRLLRLRGGGLPGGLAHRGPGDVRGGVLGGQAFCYLVDGA